MKKRYFWLSGLLFMVVLLFFFSQGASTPPAGKYHPKSPGNSQTSTVTVLNPALFHRLNTILEHGLIQGD